MTTNDAYLEPARERPNLRVIGGATVERVLIEAGRAVGVRVRVGNDWIEVRAEGIVLCAGAIHSPAILLRSGIGPDGPVVRLPVDTGCRSIRSRCSGSSRARTRGPTSPRGRPTASCAIRPSSRTRAPTT